MSQIVFSYAWWIGTQAENPEEAQLDFPKELTEVQHLQTIKVIIKMKLHMEKNIPQMLRLSNTCSTFSKNCRKTIQEAKAWSPYSPSGLAGLAPFPHYSSPLKRQRRKKMGFGGWRWKEEGIGLLEWISTPTRA
ncbi:DNA-binding protein RHL1-like [Prunus yedoensis var. nudiflora]|uniref:DNA-binding protein RHL1-like n=1 Tax=Prunus yedoensis var. nudiflora TaxID=2094558 RepID=A0A314UJW4_PRUYE|nr:DNA-binding protein RHL1-like [Prunus yedoensis var. nudiflora]